MSGLEKFEDTPAWRQKLITHLMRSPPPVSKRESMERRHSLEIVLDFPALIKAKKAELAAQQQSEIKEYDSKDINITTEFQAIYEELENTSMTEKADESFDAFERMCDKTGSDPDSTLFQYLHSDDKEQVLALAKERSARADKSRDMEMESLRRMFNDLNGQDKLENESPLKSAECTQLEDVEEPSRFWDSTIISNDSVFQPSARTSPVKMVGLLRPSTIIEANEADLTGQQSTNSSLVKNSSFLTAQMRKTGISCDSSASGSSCYETAADNSQASGSNEAPTMNVDDLFYAAIAHSKPPRMSLSEQNELLSDLHETLIDLVANDAADNTVIEVSSSDEEWDEEKDNQTNKNADIKREEISLTDIEIEEDKENKSMQFNDTLEEMDYMMQKGRELMAAKAAALSPKLMPTCPSPTPVATPTKPLSDSNVIHLHPKVPKQNTFVLSPKKQPQLSSTPSPIHQGVSSCSSSSKLPLSAIKTRYALTLEVKHPKFFKEPTGIPMRRQIKAPKNNFDHIVSPIRAYTQKSSTAPLMSMFRQAPNINDAFNTLSRKEMEEESRLCQLRRGQAADRVGNFNNSKMGFGCINPTARLLPKKAYISSELIQIVDERTSRPMPNVPKIQKYLNTAVEPTVMRHDGKMKMPGESKISSSSHIPRRPNESLADLSLASGDISLYTLKDAQKL